MLNQRQKLLPRKIIFKLTDIMIAGAGHPVHDVRSAGLPLDAALVPARRRPLLHGHRVLHPLLHVPRQLSQELGSKLAPNGELVAPVGLFYMNRRPGASVGDVVVSN